MLEKNGRKVIQEVSSLPTTGSEKYIYYNTTDGYFYGWNSVTNSFDKLSNEDLFASGSILAANACVNNVVNVPSGNPSDVKTIGTGGDFADFQTALADASVVDGTILKLLNNITTSTTINVNKAVVIDFDGFRVSGDTTNPVNVWNITAGATLKNGVLTQEKTTNTSVETVISINSPTAPVYIINNEIRIQEFGIVARGQFYIGDNKFSYQGASATNSHRFIMLNGVANESRIYNNEFTASALQGTTRYSNFIYATSGGTYSGKLFINDNTQTGGDLRQFFLHDSGVPTNMELYVANNTFNDFNGGIGIVGVNVYNGYSKIGIYNNTQGADSAGNYKGLFFVDGTGAINENVVLEYGDNILGTTTLRPDYISYLDDGSSEVTIKTSITFIDKKEKVSIQDSLSNLGTLIQDLKGRKTYIEGFNGSGTEEDPYSLPITWEHLVTNSKTDGSETPTTGGIYLVYTYRGNTIYRFLSTALDSNGYNVEDAFYDTLTGGNLTDLIIKRY